MKSPTYDAKIAKLRAITFPLSMTNKNLLLLYVKSMSMYNLLIT